MFVLFLVTRLLLIGALIWLDYVLIKSMVRGAPFAPTSRRRVERMVRLARVTPGERAVDIGSGDGRLVLALARAGAEAHGYEINPLLVLISRWRIARAGLSSTAFVYWKSFWNADFSGFQVVTVLGIRYIMEKLEEKLKRELKPGARVVSNYFTFPHWQHIQDDGGVYLYEKT